MHFVCCAVLTKTFGRNIFKFWFWVQFGASYCCCHCKRACTLLVWCVQFWVYGNCSTNSNIKVIRLCVVFTDDKKKKRVFIQLYCSLRPNKKFGHLRFVTQSDCVCEFFVYTHKMVCSVMDFLLLYLIDFSSFRSDWNWVFTFYVYFLVEIEAVLVHEIVTRWMCHQLIHLSHFCVVIEKCGEWRTNLFVCSSLNRSVKFGVIDIQSFGALLACDLMTMTPVPEPLQAYLSNIFFFLFVLFLFCSSVFCFYLFIFCMFTSCARPTTNTFG